MRLLPFEFNETIQAQKVVTKIVKSELKFKPKMTQSRFSKLHRLYLQSLKKPNQKGTYQGDYAFICFGCKNKERNTQHFVNAVCGFVAISRMKKEHSDHKWILITKQRVRKYGIKKTNSVWGFVNFL